MKIRQMKIVAALISALAALVAPALLASCQPFDIGNLWSVETAKAAALKTLEERYGVPFEFAEDYEGEPLDMETYMYWDTKSSFYKEKYWGQKFEPQRMDWQNGLFPIRVMNGLVRPAGEKETDAFHTYKVSVYATSVSDGAYGYIYEDEIRRRIMEVWKKRPADFPFLDKIKVEVRTNDVNIPENFRSMSLDEFCPIAYEQSLFAFRIRIYLYLPADGFWGKVQNRFVVGFRPKGSESYRSYRYRFSGDDWVPNERLEKEMKVLEKAVGDFYKLLKAEPSMSQFVEKKSFVFLGRLDDHFLGTHNVLGTDVFNCIGDKIDTTNSRFSAGIGYWDMETAIDEQTSYNRFSRVDVLWHRPEETDEDNGPFDMSVMSGNWHGRLGIKWVERHRKPRQLPDSKLSEWRSSGGPNLAENAGGRPSAGKKPSGGESPADGENPAERAEVGARIPADGENSAESAGGSPAERAEIVAGIPADGANSAGDAGGNPSDGGNPAERAEVGARIPAVGEKLAVIAETPSGKSAEVAENERPPVVYDDGIDESRIIEREERSDWVCLDGSAVDWVLFLQCHRQTTGIIKFDNGFGDPDVWEDYSRLRNVLVTNRINGKSKTVTLKDTGDRQEIDLRDITEPGIVMNVYELRVLDVYRGKKYEAAAVDFFDADIAEAPDGR